MAGDKFYSSKAWFKVRAQALKRDGYVCQMCGKDIRGKGIGIVDHIIMRKKRPDLALSLGNLQSLCKTPCHDSIKKRDESNPHRGCDVNGLPNDLNSDWYKES